MSDTKLLPCPFCGANGKDISTGYGYSRPRAKCANGCVNLPMEVWQSRTPPEGYVLVPVEPTDAMIDKPYDGCQSFCGHDVSEDAMREIYKAMLSAAEVK